MTQGYTFIRTLSLRMIAAAGNRRRTIRMDEICYQHPRRSCGNTVSVRRSRRGFIGQCGGPSRGDCPESPSSTLFCARTCPFTFDGYHVFTPFLTNGLLCKYIIIRVYNVNHHLMRLETCTCNLQYPISKIKYINFIDVLIVVLTYSEIVSVTVI